MYTHAKRLLGNRLTLALAIVITTLMLSLVVAQPPKTCACPSQQIEYTYFTDASHTTACGWKIMTCGCGVYKSGCQTSFYEIDYSEC